MGQITNYQATNGASTIANWANTSYPVRSTGQILPENSVQDVAELTTNYLSAAAAALDQVVSNCSAAISNSGTTAFSMVDDGVEVNQFKDKIEPVSHLASELASKIRKLKTDLDAYAVQCRKNDQQEYNNWKASDEYKNQQQQTN